MKGKDSMGRRQEWRLGARTQIQLKLHQPSYAQCSHFMDFLKTFEAFFVCMWKLQSCAMTTPIHEELNEIVLKKGKEVCGMLLFYTCYYWSVLESFPSPGCIIFLFLGIVWECFIWCRKEEYLIIIQIMVYFVVVIDLDFFGAGSFQNTIGR